MSDSTLNQTNQTTNILKDMSKLPANQIKDAVDVTNTNLQTQDPKLSELKVFPLDFTHLERYRTTLRNIATPHDIMDIINGPKINSLSYHNYKLTPKIVNANNTHFLGNELLGLSTHTTHTKTNAVSGSTTFEPSINYRGERVYVRRNYTNQQAMVDLNWMKQNPYTRDRTANSVANYSVLHYPHLMCHYEVDPVVRCLSFAPIVPWLNGNSITYGANDTKPTFKIIALSTIENQMKTGYTDSIPIGAIPLNLGSLASSSLGKLIIFGANTIIDMSDNYEQTVTAKDCPAYDSEIAKVLETTFNDQDIEWAHWYASAIIPMCSTETVCDSQQDLPSTTIPLPDPFEIIWTYLTEVRHKEGARDCLSKWHSSNYGVYLTVSYRIAKTFLYQQALKQVHIWLNPDAAIAKGIADENTLNIMLGAFVNNIGTILTRKESSNKHKFMLAWIPYELCEAYGRKVDIDDPMLTNSRAGYSVPKSVVRPPSYLTNAINATILSYSNVWDEVFDLNYAQGTGTPLLRAMPANLYVYTGGDKDRSLYTRTGGISGTSFIMREKLEGTTYFPMPVIVTDV